MGAAAIAGAAGYQLYAFVPDHVSETVVSILTNLGTNVVKVSRDGSVGEGDPCNLRYQEALKNSAGFRLRPTAMISGLR